MAELTELESAFMKADQAGDTQAAKALHDEIMRQRQSQQGGSTWDRLTKPDFAQDPGMLYPVSKDAQGNNQWDWSAGLPGAVGRAVTLPYDVYRGNVQMTDPETGRTSDEAIGRSNEAAAVLSPASRAGTPLPGAANPLKPAQPPKFTYKDLLKEGGRQLDIVEKSGATYPTGVLQRLPDYVAARMRQSKGPDLRPEVSPATFELLQSLRTPDAAARYSSIQDLMVLRRTLGELAGRKEERAAATAAINAIDEVIRRFGDNGVSSGPSTLPTRGGAVGQAPSGNRIAAELYPEANANYAAGKRGELLDRLDYETVLQAAGANSGKNVGNTYRQKVKAALIQDKKYGPRRRTELSGFNEGEKAMMEQLVRGTGPQNAIRDVGNLLGGGGGMGQNVAAATGGIAGTYLGGPMVGAGTALGVYGLGRGLKGVDNRMSQKAFEEIMQRILQRSPMYQKEAARPRLGATKSPSTEAIIRALVAGQVQGE